ncbi:MAG: LytTR family transcriptional regulator DNA-binding domain-containing protein [Saprospiraceae bacterium]|nr:LytTR family transcriptional regulator DNA-binding domain-containing protein [Saprospiraceae bacterium]
MKILIIESENQQAERLVSIVKSLNFELAGICKDSDLIFQNIYELNPDILFICIHENLEKYIELFEKLLANNIPIIFFTSKESDLDFNIEERLKNAITVILPVHTVTLNSIINLLIQNVSALQKKAKLDLTVRGRQGQKININPDKILWIEVEGNYCFLKTEHNKFGLKVSLNNLLTSLDDRFIQIHRSFVINKDELSFVELTKKRIWIKNTYLPIGRVYKDKLMNILSDKIKL